MAEQQYWVTSAQVIPVLALALIVEARSTIQRWDPDFPRWLRAFQGLLWSFPLILFALILPKCFQAISGSTIWGGYEVLVRVSIIACVNSLILAPVFEVLLTTHARVIARAIVATVTAKLGMDIYRSWLYAKRRERQAKRMAEEGRRLARSYLDALNYYEEMAHQVSDATPEEREEILTKIRRMKGKMWEEEGRISEYEDYWTNALEDVKKSRNQLRRVKLERVADIQRELELTNFPYSRRPKNEEAPLD